MKNTLGLCSHGLRIHAKLRFNSDSAYSCAAIRIILYSQPHSSTQPSVSTRKWILPPVTQKVWACLTFFEFFWVFFFLLFGGSWILSSTSKLMYLYWFPSQEVESYWSPCSPNSLAAWCFPFTPARTAGRWCSAVRPRDTQHPSTGNTRRHGFVCTVWFLLLKTLR